MTAAFTINSQILFAISTGLAIPAVFFGRAVLAVFVFLSLSALLASTLRSTAWQETMRLARGPVGVLIGLTILSWSVSAIGSSFPLRSLEASLRTGLIIGCGTMVYAGLASDSKLPLIAMRALVVFSLATVALSIIIESGVPELYWFIKLRGWLSIPVNASLKGYSALSVLLIPLLLFGATRVSVLWRVAAISSSVGILIVVWQTYNRAALAGLLIALLVTGIAWCLKARRRAQIAIYLSTIGALIAAVLWWLRSTRLHFENASPLGDWIFPVWLIDFQRQTIWKKVFEIADSHPWFGIGANTINFAPGANQPLPGNEILHIIPSHPHNWFVEVYAETGLVGLACLIGVIGTVFWLLFSAYARTRHDKMLVGIAISAGYWSSGLFNFSYWSVWWQASFVIALAIALSVDERSEE